MSTESSSNEIQTSPEIQIRPVDLCILALALVPLAWSLWHGPSGTVHAQILVTRSDSGLFKYDAGRILIALIQQIPYGFWLLIMAQGVAMSMAVVGVAAIAERLFPLQRASFWSSVFLVGTGAWTRWSASVTPDMLPNCLGLLGLLAWIYLRWSQPCPNPLAYLVGIETLLFAAILSGFWKIVALVAFTDMAVIWFFTQIEQRPCKPPVLPAILATILAASVFMSGIATALVAQTPEGRVLSGQVLSGYPDFHVGDISGKPRPILVGFVRVGMELAQIRSAYSWRHNGSILLLAWPMLILSAVSIWKQRRSPWMLPIGVLLAVWSVMVSRTYADWDNRFLTIIWPVIALMASGVAHRIGSSRLFHRALLAASVSGLLVMIFHESILISLGQWLVVNDPQPADVMVVLVGGDPDRDQLAAELFRQGFAQEIWLANEGDMAESDPRNDAGNLIRRLLAGGVPRDRIRLLPTARNTTAEAQRVAEYVDSLSPETRPHSITVVTTSFHTRRARFLFRKYLAKSGVAIHMAASQDPTLPAVRWWAQRHAKTMYTGEIAKILFTWLGLG
ncbi:MAG: YdcF family protein [Planctomycetota bacterium]|nr:MAG: YdcF family protein [Planctomycetota bacterium]